MRTRRFWLSLVFSLLLVCLLPLAAHAQSLPAGPTPGDETIVLQAGTFDPLQQPAPPALAAATAATSAAATSSPYYLVQFAGPVQQTWLEQVAALGGEVLGYIPHNTHIVRLAPEAVARVQSLPGVRWVGPYRPEYKLAPALAAAQVTAAERDGLSELSVIAFAGEQIAPLAAFVQANGGVVQEAADTPIGPVLRIAAPPSLASTLAQQPAVAWVEPYIEPTTANAEARKIMGAEAVWQSFGYYGAGQIVAISDSGLSVQNGLSPDFAGRLVRGYAPSEMNLSNAQCKAKTTYTDLNGHGTHVAGSVLGNGTRSGSNPANHDYGGSNAGVAPEAQVVFMALNTDGSSGIQCINVNGDFLAKGYEEGARISTNSWGASDRGGYNLLASLTDDYIWRHKDYLVLFAAGNAGPGAQTVGSPGTAKNVLTVGAGENFRPDQGTDSDNPADVASFSSRGPTADGRVKPEVVAPGTWILSVRAAQAPDSSFWGSFNADYAFMGGTSMATPLTAGGAALVREWLGKARGILNPSAALLKAVLINGATQLPGAGVANQNSGYGRVDLKNTLNANYVILDDHVQGLTTGNTVSYTLQVVASGAQGTLFALAAGPAVTQAGATTAGLRLDAPPPLQSAAAAIITTPTAIRGEALPAVAQARPQTPIPTGSGQVKNALTPLTNPVPAIAARQGRPTAQPLNGQFSPYRQSDSLETQDFQQEMIGGGDFEDPAWTDLWSQVWLGSGVPERTSDPSFVLNGNYSMWLGGTPADDALFYPVQFPDQIDGTAASGIRFDVRVINQDVNHDAICVALIDASGYFIGPFAPDQPDCADQNGDYTYTFDFSAAERQTLAGQAGYLAVFTSGNGIAPHMSAFVDDISLILDFPPVQATITPAAGPPGTTFLLTGKYNLPYAGVDVCISPCGPGNTIATTDADGAGNIAVFLYTAPDIGPGPYAIQTLNVAQRTATASLTILASDPPTLTVQPLTGPAGTQFKFTGSNFIPNDSAIAITVNGAALGSTGSDAAGDLVFTIQTATNLPAGAYTVKAQDSAGRSAMAQFNVTAVTVGDPVLSVTPAAGAPGTTFTFVAGNFTPSAPADVALDGQVLGQVNIDATGTATLTLSTKPTTIPGRYTLAVSQGTRTASAQYDVTGSSGGTQSGAGLYVTLTWTDPPAQAAAGQTLVNDLDLWVDGPGGRSFANGGTGPDRVNTVEAIRLEQPAAGKYVITVTAQRVNAAFGSQPYALVATSRQSFGAGQAGAELGQVNSAVLNGVVFADLDRDGARDAGEPGISGAQVVVQQTGASVSRQAVTDAAGAYRADSLPAGDYTITVFAPAGLRLTTAATARTTVSAGNNTAPNVGAVTELYLPLLRR